MVLNGTFENPAPESRMPLRSAAAHGSASCHNQGHCISLSFTFSQDDWKPFGMRWIWSHQVMMKFCVTDFTIEEINARKRMCKQVTGHCWWFVRLAVVARVLLNIKRDKSPGWGLYSGQFVEVTWDKKLNHHLLPFFSLFSKTLSPYFFLFLHTLSWVFTILPWILFCHCFFLLTTIHSGSQLQK